MDTSTEKQSLSPNFFFISLGVLITLITSVSSLLILFFETLNKKFPDILNSTYQFGYNTYSYDTIRSTLATLIIFFPVFLFLSYFWKKLLKSDLGAKDNIIFKWMIYLIVFISSIVVIIDLVTLVQYFVSGEITSRFIFKVIGAAIIAVLVGLNFFNELKNNEKRDDKNNLSILYLIISILIFFGLVIWSFAVMGSPTKQRALRLDERRVTDLQSIQYQVITYWQQKEKLPITLLELANPMSGFSLPVDPEFEKGNMYEYISKEPLSFELCATFTAEMPKGWQESTYTNDMKVSSTYGVVGGGNESWDHEVGRTCFTRTIDKDIYPPFKK